jgi:hypothetical protein
MGTAMAHNLVKAGYVVAPFGLDCLTSSFESLCNDRNDTYLVILSLDL